MNSKMNSKMKISDKANILASRDKHSVVRSFQDTFKEDIKFSKQRASRLRPSAEQSKPKHEFRVGAMTVPYDADKLARDAGGNIKNVSLSEFKIPPVESIIRFVVSAINRRP